MGESGCGKSTLGKAILRLVPAAAGEIRIDGTDIAPLEHEQLSAMRADLFLCDPHRIIVNGPTKLRGRALDSRDLRSGMALIAAALAAEGESLITPIEMVERGYALLVDRLASLGAVVERVP